MKKFEYCRLEVTRIIATEEDKRTEVRVLTLIEPDGNIVDFSNKKMTVVLNELGVQGWELVSSTDTFLPERIVTNCMLKKSYN